MKAVVGTHPETRMVPDDMPICPHPLLLHTRRIRFMYAGKVAIEPMPFLWSGKVPNRRTIGAYLAEDQDVEYKCCRDQRYDEERVGCSDE